MNDAILTLIAGTIIFGCGYCAMWYHVNNEGDMPDGVDWEDWL